MSDFLDILRQVDALQDKALKLAEEAFGDYFPDLLIEDGKISLDGSYGELKRPEEFRLLAEAFAELGGVSKPHLESDSQSHRITSDVCKLCEKSLVDELVNETRSRFDSVMDSRFVP